MQNIGGEGRNVVLSMRMSEYLLNMNHIKIFAQYEPPNITVLSVVSIQRKVDAFLGTLRPQS